MVPLTCFLPSYRCTLWVTLRLSCFCFILNLGRLYVYPFLDGGPRYLLAWDGNEMTDVTCHLFLCLSGILGGSGNSLKPKE